MDTNVILSLVTAILTVIAALVGAKWQGAKSKAGQLTDLLNTVVEAAKDDKVTEEEFQVIVDKVKALMNK